MEESVIYEGAYPEPVTEGYPEPAAETGRFVLPEGLRIEQSTEQDALSCVDAGTLDGLLGGPAVHMVTAGFAACTVLFLLMYAVSRAVRLIDMK